MISQNIFRVESSNRSRNAEYGLISKFRFIILLARDSITNAEENVDLMRITDFISAKKLCDKYSLRVVPISVVFSYKRRGRIEA